MIQSNAPDYKLVLMFHFFAPNMPWIYHHYTYLFCFSTNLSIFVQGPHVSSFCYGFVWKNTTKTCWKKEKNKDALIPVFWHRVWVWTPRYCGLGFPANQEAVEQVIPQPTASWLHGKPASHSIMSLWDVESPRLAVPWATKEPVFQPIKKLGSESWPTTWISDWSGSRDCKVTR